MKAKTVSLFLDSGAYSAMTQGIEIDMDEYIKFIKKHQEYIEIYACLDVIGDPVATYKNQKYMMKKGLNPIIAFHKGEDYKWLRKYLDEFEYVALGGIAGTGDSMRIVRRHLDTCWGIICDTKDRMPRRKIHGFGLTSIPLLFRYPWYSCDSTTWVMASRFGSVIVPKFRQGKPSYAEIPQVVSVSNKSPDMKEFGSRHFQTYSPVEKETILEYFQSKGYGIGKSSYKKVKSPDYELKEGEKWFGKEEADAQRSIHGADDRSGYVWAKDLIVEIIEESGLSNDYTQRDVMNIIYFLDLEKNLPKWPCAFKAETNMLKGFGLR
jgi:hypothetical protein